MVSTDTQGGVTVLAFGLRLVSHGKTAVSTLHLPSFPRSLNACVFALK